MAVALAEHLDGGLAIEHRGDDLAVLGGALRSHDDPVAVADRGVDHRVADDLQHEQLALADQLTGKRENLVDLLLGGDGNTGCDAPDERHHRRVADRGGVGLRGRPVGHARQLDEHFECARTVGIAPEVAGELELVELVGHARQRGEPDGVADLAHARRVAAARDRTLDHLEDGDLLRAQTLAAARPACCLHVVDVGAQRLSPS